MEIYLITSLIVIFTLFLFFTFKITQINYNLKQISDNLDKIYYNLIKDKYDYN
jgi:hypothetical protein